MTKAIPPNRLLIKKRDGNQEDIHVLDPVKRLFKLQQQQSPDRDEKTEKLQSTCNRTRDARRPTLEELLDLELDLVLPATGMSAPANNQLPVCVAREEDVDSVSLELLAMQSPHGENQQWQQGEEEEEHDSTPPEHSPRNKMDEPLAPRKSMPLNISSPTAFSSSFPFSPTHSAADDDYGLASPMALPDSPSQGKSAIALALDLELAFPRLEDGHAQGESSRRLVQSTSVQRLVRRASTGVFAARATTPNPRNHNYCVPERPASRITRASLPSLPEVRGKARHGGIYSLLLQNKSGTKEPVLVEDAHNPEEVVTAVAPSVYKGIEPTTIQEGHSMNRIFGKKKPEEAPVNISDVGGKVDARVTDLDMKIDKLDQELRKYREQMKKTKGPAVNAIKQRAMQTLKRKKMFEAQRDKLQAQSFNIEQAAFAIDTSRDTISTVAAMKSAAVQLKAETQKIDISELEDVQDDMADLMEDMNEIQEIMGRSYGIGDEIDEDELEAELEGLEEEWAEEEAIGDEAEQAPSYLAPAQHHELPAAPSGTLDSGRTARATDEFGLPVASYST